MQVYSKRKMQADEQWSLLTELKLLLSKDKAALRYKNINWLMQGWQSKLPGENKLEALTIESMIIETHCHTEVKLTCHEGV